MGIGGTKPARAADCLSNAVSGALKRGVCGVRLGKSLEGEFEEGETVVMIEDLANTAGSIVEAAKAIGSHDLTITDAVVLLDYQKGGARLLAENGIQLHAFMTVRELVDIMFAEGKIDPEHHQKCVDFLNS